MKKVLNRIKIIFDYIGKCIIPLMPIFIGIGMAKIVTIILGPSTLNILHEDSKTLLVLNAAMDCGYYFIPIFIGFSSAKVFKTNQIMGALMGAFLLAPDYVECVENETALSFLNINVPLANYGSQMIPVIIAVYVMSIIYNFLDNHLYKQIKDIFVSTLTVLIMIPIVMCFIGPIGILISNFIVKMVMWLMSLGPLGSALMSCIVLFQLALGIAKINISIMILLLTMGPDPGFMYSLMVFDINLGAVVLAIYARNKDPKALTAGLTSCIAGVGDPCVFGYVIKDIKAIIPLCVGDFIGSYVGVSLGVKTFAVGSCGIFGIASTIGEGSSIVNALIGILIASIIGFTGSYLLHKNNAK